MGRSSRAQPSEERVWREIRRLWGNKLAPIPQDLVDADASESTRSLLTHVGLPTDGPLGVTFFLDERLLDPLSAGGDDYLMLGHDYGTALDDQFQALSVVVGEQ